MRANGRPDPRRDRRSSPAPITCIPAAVSSTPLGRPSVPLVTTIAAVPAGAGTPPGNARAVDVRGPEPVEQRGDLGRRERGVDRQDGAALVPATEGRVGQRRTRPPRPRRRRFRRRSRSGCVRAGHARYPNRRSDHSQNLFAPRPARRPHGARDPARRRVEAGDSRRLHRRHLRDRRRDRQDHDLPARGAQRVPAPHAVRVARRVRDRPRRSRKSA